MIDNAERQVNGQYSGQSDQHQSQQQLQELQRKVNQLNEKLKRITSELNEKTNICDELSMRTESYERDLEETRSQLIEVRELNEKLNSQLVDQQHQLEFEADELKSALADVEQQLETAELTLKQERADKQRIATQVNSQASCIKLLEKEKNLLLGDKDACARELESTRSDLKLKEDEIKHLLASSKKNEIVLEAESADLAHKLERANAMLQRHEDTLKSTEELKEQAEASHAHQKAIKAKDEYIGVLEEKIAVLNKSIKDKDKKNIELFNSQKTVADQAKKHDAQLAGCKDELERTKKQLSLKTLDVKSITVKWQDAQKNMQEITSKCESLEEKNALLTQHTRTLNQLQQQQQLLENNNNNNNSNISTNNHSSNLAGKAGHISMDEFNSMKGYFESKLQMNELQGQEIIGKCEAMQAEIDALQSENLALNCEVNELNAANESLSVKIEDLSSRNQFLSDENAKLYEKQGRNEEDDNNEIDENENHLEDRITTAFRKTEPKESQYRKKGNLSSASQQSFSKGSSNHSVNMNARTISNSNASNNTGAVTHGSSYYNQEGNICGTVAASLFSPEMLSSEETIALMLDVLRRTTKSSEMMRILSNSEEFIDLIETLKGNQNSFYFDAHSDQNSVHNCSSIASSAAKYASTHAPSTIPFQNGSNHLPVGGASVNASAGVASASSGIPLHLLAQQQQQPQNNNYFSQPSLISQQQQQFQNQNGYAIMSNSGNTTQNSAKNSIIFSRQSQNSQQLQQQQQQGGLWLPGSISASVQQSQYLSSLSPFTQNSFSQLQHQQQMQSVHGYISDGTKNSQSNLSKRFNQTGGSTSSGY